MLWIVLGWCCWHTVLLLSAGSCCSCLGAAQAMRLCPRMAMTVPHQEQARDHIPARGSILSKLHATLQPGEHEKKNKEERPQKGWVKESRRNQGSEGEWRGFPPPMFLCAHITSGMWGIPLSPVGTGHVLTLKHTLEYVLSWHLDKLVFFHAVVEQHKKKSRWLSRCTPRCVMISKDFLMATAGPVPLLMPRLGLQQNRPGSILPALSFCPWWTFIFC